MAHYTKLQDHEIQSLAAQYQLEITSYQPIEQGAGNSNYLLKSKVGQYILTIFEIDRLKVVNMCKVLLRLEKRAFPAPRIRNLPDGDPLIVHQGKPVLVKPYIAGEVFDDFNQDQLSQLGTALAELHQISAPQGLPDQHGYMKKELPQVLQKRSDHSFSRWMAGRYRQLIRKIPAELPSGLIHGDLFSDNVLFDGKKFKAMLDFEDVCHYHKAFDIGMAIVGLCRENKQINLGKARSVVRGYQSIRLLEVPEREALQSFTELAAILTSAWRFWKYNIDLTGTQKSNKYLEMVQIAKQIVAIPKSEFLETIVQS
jgi:homoserine kinase type II